MDIEVLHSIEESKFYCIVEETEAHLEYNRENNTLNCYHTFVPPSMRGKKIAQLLVLKLIDFAQTHKLKIIPTCSYIYSFFKRNKKYSYLLD